jgi:hypothetical protein
MDGSGVVPGQDMGAVMSDSLSSDADLSSKFDNLWNAGAFDTSSQPKKEVQPAQAAEPAPADQTNEQVDPNAPKTQDQQDAQPDTAEEGPVFESLADVAKAANLEADALHALPVTVKIDGVEKSVPLSEVIHSYQLQGHVNNKSVAVAQERVALEQERTADRGQRQAALGEMQQLAQYGMNLLMSDYQSIDWNGLRNNDPGRFAALQVEYANKQQQIAGFMQNLQQRGHQLTQQEKQQADVQQQTQIQTERNQLFDLKPEWRDEAKFAPERQAMIAYARKQGISDAELGSLIDHRFMLVLHDAAQFAALQAKAPAVLKKVREAPPMAKAGPRGSMRSPQDANRQQALERFMSNPRDEDAALAVFDRLAQ